MNFNVEISLRSREANYADAKNSKWQNIRQPGKQMMQYPEMNRNILVNLEVPRYFGKSRRPFCMTSFDQHKCYKIINWFHNFGLYSTFGWHLKYMIFFNHQCFGNKSDCKLSFDNQEITQVEHYKYVGNIIKPVEDLYGDIYGDNYNFLCDKAKKAIFAMKKKATGYLPPSVMFYMFNTLIRPILSYGSRNWGVRKTGCSANDKVLFSFMKHTLYVKQSTSSIMTIGECGQIPPSVVCHTNVIKYMDKVRNMNDCHFVKQVYNELSRLHELGLTTWYSRAWNLVHQYNIDLFNNDGDFKTYCKSFIESKFRENWELDVQNIDKSHPPYLCKD